MAIANMGLTRNYKFKILTKDLALSRSCGLQSNSAQPLKTTRKCPKSNPVQGELEGAAPRPLNILGVWGVNPQIRVLTKQSTPNLELLVYLGRNSKSVLAPSQGSSLLKITDFCTAAIFHRANRRATRLGIPWPLRIWA
jgi:hypothetical protein